LKKCSWDDAELGDDDRALVMEPTDIIQAALESDPKSNMCFIGRVAMSRTFRTYLINLMALNHWEKRDSTILEEKIIKPVFIVGLNRSGTTFLQNLLASDPKFRTTRFCEMVAPYGESGDLHLNGLDHKNYNWKCDPRLGFAQDTLDSQMGSDNKQWLGIHAQVADGPEEEFIILEHIGRSYSIACPYPSNEYRSWLFDNNCKELKRVYPFHKRFLQHLQHQIRGDRWILKMPFHLFTLDALLDEYPDAKIVWMHRNPIQTIASWSSLVYNARTQMIDDVDKKSIGYNELVAMRTMIESAINARNHMDQNIFLDISYENLIADPLTVVKRVHNFIEEGDCDVSYVERFIENDRMTTKYKPHKYTLEEFGLTEVMVDENFSEYNNFTDKLGVMK